jgi:streptogramin lyase
MTEFRLPTPESQPRGLAVGFDQNLWFTEQAGNKLGLLEIRPTHDNHTRADSASGSVRR